jgi:hypothetical protein
MRLQDLILRRPSKAASRRMAARSEHAAILRDGRRRWRVGSLLRMRTEPVASHAKAYANVEMI